MRGGREEECEGWEGGGVGGVGGRRRGRGGREEGLEGRRQNKQVIYCLEFLRFCQGTDGESCAQTPLSSREEKGSGVTSPNPWTSSRRCRLIKMQSSVYWNNAEVRTSTLIVPLKVML